jgi:1,4-alpha-glucan branching enzyme
MQSLIRDLNTVYCDLPQLSSRDCEGEGFEWLIADDHENSVFAWMRKSGGHDTPVVVIANLTPVPREGYEIPMPRVGAWRERINSDARVYGGSGAGNMGMVQATEGSNRGFAATARILLPPLATLILEFAA